jgi:glycosyltransferase involved in cell wall biosynthesis
MCNKYKFSVLMPVYHKDNPVFFEAALNSVYRSQSTKPNEIVLVVDGPIGDPLDKVIKNWQSAYPDILTVVYLEENIGLGGALAIGLEKCKYDLVARMDSDDLARGDRFRVQLRAFEINPSLSICGSNVAEFIDDPLIVSGSRKVPENMKDIVPFSKRRNPINHPSVMFKRQVVINVGSYLPMPYFEDYFLWIRCIVGGYTLLNIQDTLVSMRAGPGQLERRAGFQYVRHELVFFRELRVLKFVSIKDLIKVLPFRVGSRLVPKKLLKIIYWLLRK